MKSKIILRVTDIRIIRNSSLSEEIPGCGWLVETLQTSIRMHGMQLVLTVLLFMVMVSVVVCSRTRSARGGQVRRA